MVGGDRHLCLPPLRLVAVVRGGAPVELVECTDAAEGGLLGVEFVIIGAGLLDAAAILTGDNDFGGNAVFDFIWLLCVSLSSILMGGIGSKSAVFFSSSLGSTCVTMISRVKAKFFNSEYTKTESFEKKVYWIEKTRKEVSETCFLQEEEKKKEARGSEN